MKTALTTAPVLALPNRHKPFVIETNASDKGIGAVLQQDGHPIAYVSKALGPTYEKECLAILLAVEHWRTYLQHSEFTLKTDQRSLVHLDDQRLTTPWEHKAMTKLLGLRYNICYKKGVENKVADALSRIPPHSEQEVIAMTVIQSYWLQELVDSYASDPKTAKLLSSLAINNSCGPFTLHQGVIKYRGRIWVGNNHTIQIKILQSLHSGPLGGHSGFPATYKRIHNLFAWPGQKQMIKKFVAECTVCQQAKPERVKYPGLLQPLPIPKFAWQLVSLGFVEGLPTSHHFNCILVVVDKFSKYAHFIPLKHPFTAFQVAMAYMDNIFKLHGLPEAIISDNQIEIEYSLAHFGKNFLS